MRRRQFDERKFNLNTCLVVAGTWESVNAIREIQKKQVSGEARNTQALPILSFGHSLAELEMKHKVLSELGHRITSLSDFSTVESLIVKAGRTFTVLIVGPNVGVQEREALARPFRRHNSQGKVILFYWESIINAEQATAVSKEVLLTSGITSAASTPQQPPPIQAANRRCINLIIVLILSCSSLRAAHQASRKEPELCRSDSSVSTARSRPSSLGYCKSSAQSRSW